MMTRKFALLIGNSQYQDPKLAKLKAPDSDVSELAKILEDPTVGGFYQVTQVLSELSTNVREAIGDFFADKKPDDLLLLYFSGHGVKDDNGRLHLAVKDTRHNRLSATGIPASFIREEMENCRPKRKVLVLDCCCSGAFARGKGVGSHAITPDTFGGSGGYGQAVLTASSAVQYAWEGDQVIGDVETSLFTHFLIQGLRTGQADADYDGYITLDELYEYVYEQVGTHMPSQTPQMWVEAREGKKLVIALSYYRPTDLPPDLREASESTTPNVRAGAARELGQLLHGSDKSLVRQARGILRAMAKKDDSPQVRILVSTILREYEQTKTAKDIPGLSKPTPRERTPLTKPIPIRRELVHASSVPNAPGRNWFLWGGIGTVMMISIVLYLFGSFLFNGLTPPTSTVTPTLTMMSPPTGTLASAETGTPALPTSTSILTDTPTITPVSPTSTLVPTTVVPNNTPTYTLTLIPTITPSLTPSRTPTPTFTRSPTPIPSRDPFTIPGSAVLCDGDDYSGDCEDHSFAGQDVCINLGGINDRANSLYFTGEYQGNFDVVFYRDSNCNTYLARIGSATSSFGLINDQFSSIAFYYYK